MHCFFLPGVYNVVRGVLTRERHMPETAEKYRIRADQFVRMAEEGIIAPSERVELIGGEIVAMSPVGDRHEATTSRLVEAFAGLLDRVVLRVQCSVRIGTHDLPEPDFVLARPRPDRYANGKPDPEDVLLVVEVAESSLLYDRDVKGALYAECGIPEYWILNLRENRLEVHRRAAEGGWEERLALGPEDSIAPLAFPHHEVAVDRLLP